MNRRFESLVLLFSPIEGPQYCTCVKGSRATKSCFCVLESNFCAVSAYSGDFLKVNHFRRCLALYVRGPRVGNFALVPALLREFCEGIIINQSNHIINTYTTIQS